MLALFANTDSLMNLKKEAALKHAKEMRGWEQLESDCQLFDLEDLFEDEEILELNNKAKFDKLLKSNKYVLFGSPCPFVQGTKQMFDKAKVRYKYVDTKKEPWVM